MSISETELQAAASRLQRESDQRLAEYKLLAASLLVSFRRMKGQDNDSLVDAAINTYILELSALVSRETASLATLAAQIYQRLFPTYPVELIRGPSPADVYSSISTIRTSLELARMKIAQQTTQTGLPLATLAPQIMSSGKAEEINRYLDSTTQQMLHGELWRGGEGRFGRKISVPVIDGRTTNLCRTRMAFQIRAYNEPYIDPVTGSSWMYPPFIGSLLPANERFHYCRSASFPA